MDSYIDKNGEEKEKFMELRFIDSFKFMATSLDLLTKILVGGGQRLAGFEKYSESQYKLLTRKGIYPYEYMTSWQNLKKPNFLLSKLSIALSMWLALATTIINTPSEFGKNLEFIT